MAKLDDKLKKMADKYGLFTKEEILQAYDELERMNIGIFVTVFGKEKHETGSKDNSGRGRSRNNGAYIHTR